MTAENDEKTGRGFWRGMMLFILGILLLCFAFLFIMITERAVLLWLNTDNYVPTEVEVLQLLPDTGTNGKALISVRVDATGEKLLTRGVPRELYVFDGPKDMTGKLMKPEEAKGKKFAVWYSARAKGFFSDLRIAYPGEFEPASTARNAIVVVGTHVLIIALGCLFLIKGYKRTRRAGLSRSP
jgi:hypothetical protein